MSLLCIGPARELGDAVRDRAAKEVWLSYCTLCLCIILSTHQNAPERLDWHRLALPGTSPCSWGGEKPYANGATGRFFGK
ncbi:hypothetical protein NDI44_10400 [Trichocoleus sp. DQ-A3]|uniref:hypothetical protein n=1 Tax=Cyanophyceae TaxID=3028117 RepID=UPI001682B1E3|nr:hypothetical protein [Coleofasciculus sp. FACHB-125]MBD1903168.1 hypothetical protein [Coleofasciculus sp. FACHB-125]